MGSNHELTTKQFIPIIKDRLTTKIKLTPNFTAILTAHGKTKAYLHRFKIIESPECPCDGGNQTVNHLLYDCTKLQREREKLISNLSKQDNWPVNESDLVKKHKIFHSVQKLNRFWETVISLTWSNNCKRTLTRWNKVLICIYDTVKAHKNGVYVTYE